MDDDSGIGVDDDGDGDDAPQQASMHTAMPALVHPNKNKGRIRHTNNNNNTYTSPSAKDCGLTPGR